LFHTAVIKAQEKNTIETSVAMMAKIGACWSPSFSPDGETVAFISNMNGIPQIWTIPREGGWPTLMTSLNDPIGSVAWSPSGKWLSFSMAPGGGMNQQIYIIRPDGSEIRLLTDGGNETNRLGNWTSDGRKLMMSSNRRLSTAMDAYLVDMENMELELISTSKGIGSFSDITTDGKYAILNRLESRGSNDLFLIETQTGQEKIVTDHKGPGTFFGQFSSSEREIYVGFNKNRNLVAFGKIKITEKGKPGPIEILVEKSDAELESFKLNNDATLAALIWNVSGRNELTFFDLQKNQVINNTISLPSEIVRGIDFSKNGKWLAVELSGATTPRDIWILNTETYQFRQLTYSPHAGVDLKTLIAPRLVHFSAHDGLKLTGWLYHPQSSYEPGPIVLSFHGGPEGQERPRFRSDYQALLAQGISILAPNVRGSSGFGKKFVNLDNGELRFNGIKDIKSCVEYVISSGIADPQRIGIMGGSYGGYMVMAGLAYYPDLISVGANLFGVVNFETFFANTEPWMAAISTIEYGDPVTQKDLLKSLSPIHMVDQVRAPTIVLHGANDTNVPVVEAEQVVENLKKRGVPVEYILFPDEGHGFRKTINRICSTSSIVSWFVKYL
jgi:dipeptidyl aminopeptidase/acylaminoacyl peptidase